MKRNIFCNSSKEGYFFPLMEKLEKDIYQKKLLYILKKDNNQKTQIS